MPRLFLILALMAGPALCEPANLSATPAGAPGAASRLARAHRLHAQALKDSDAATLITAIRLARGITLRPAAGWTRQTTGTAAPDQPQAGPGPANPAGPDAIAMARVLAGEDPTLQDLVYDLDAQLPSGRIDTVAAASAVLAAGQTDVWRIAFFGESPADLAVIGDGGTALELRVSDGSDTPVCAAPAATDPATCAFVPARNGFFTVSVRNTGQAANHYLLVTN